MLKQRISKALKARELQNLTRQRKLTQPTGAGLLSEGQDYTNFSSNDYLGLATSDELKKAFKHGVSLFGCGSTGSPLVNGYHPVYQDLELALAEWLGYDKVMLFSTGFCANSTLLKTLFNKQDKILQDKLNHASLIDGGVESSAKSQRFKHNDMAHLKLLLAKTQATMSGCDEAIQAIVSEGVFSMDGDSANMGEINQLADEYKALTILDDAHGIGVFGDTGQGSWHPSNRLSGHLSDKAPDILVATFGKAFGLSGAFVASNHDYIDYLLQYSRSYIYSTALPPALAYAILQAIELVKNEHWRRDKLNDNIMLFKQLMSGSHFSLLDSQSAIQPIVIGSASKTLSMAAYLKSQGIWTTAIRPPTVPENSARLRITLNALHSKDDIVNLVKQLKKAS